MSMKKNWSQKRHGERRKQKPQDSRGRATGLFAGRRETNRPKLNKKISENLKLSISENDKAIKEFWQSKPLCPRCGETIENIMESLCDKQTGAPIHFECVLSLLNEQEKTGLYERIIYIGKGRFAVAFYPNQKDDRNFSIRKIIEWEEAAANQDSPWRKEISGLFSQVK
jgi:hypothetical protein